MRTRELKLLHYKIDPAERSKLMKLARLKENEDLILISTEESCGGISDPLFISLTKGWGYDRLYKKMYIPATKADFYAYRRRALYIFKLLLKARNTEEKSVCNV